MNKAIIGIVGKPDQTKSLWSYTTINNEIKNKINNNNALAIGIIPQNNMDDLKEILKKVDGVILQGGIISKSYEQEIVKLCIDMDLPLLGICSGFNNMIEALGGVLYNDDNNIHQIDNDALAYHNVEINKNSKLYNIIGRDNINVNSIHKKVALPNSIKGFNISATCPIDNTVEGIELFDKRFIMGIKWHPELMEDDNNLFKSFIEACNKNKD